MAGSAAHRSWERYDSLGFWRRRNRRNTLSQFAAQANYKTHDAARSFRGDATIVRALLKDGVQTLAVALGIILVIELVATELRAQPWMPAVGVLGSAAPADASPFVAAVASAAATLLGLYYATVGVVVSSVYRDVAADIRTLFIRERQGAIYVNALVAALTWSLVILVAWGVGYSFSQVSVMFLAVLAVLTVVLLSILGRSLFGFLDPAQLGGSMYRELRSTLPLAASRRTKGLATVQEHARQRTADGVRGYALLGSLLRDSQTRDPAGPMKLASQLLDLALRYAVLKSSIPSGSMWWAQRAPYRNWFTLNEFEMRTAVRHAIDLPAQTGPDFLWLEADLSQSLAPLFSIVQQTDQPDRNLALSGQLAQLAFVLGCRLQTDELGRYERVHYEAMVSVATAAVTRTDAAGIRLAVDAGSSIIAPTAFAYTGIVRLAQSLSARDLRAEFGRVMDSPARHLANGYPVRVRQVVDELHAGIALERRTEGERVTPQWWANHHLAKALAYSLHQAEVSVAELAVTRAFKAVELLRDHNRARSAAGAAMAALNLFSSVRESSEIIHRAHENLGKLCSDSIGSGAWPTRDKSALPVEAYVGMLILATTLLPPLRETGFDPDTPDSYGQIFHLAQAGMFDGLFENDLTVAATLYDAVFNEYQAVEERRRQDVAGTRVARFEVATSEQLVTLMEFAGYAILLNEVGSPQAWDHARVVWEAAIAIDGELPVRALLAAQTVDGAFADFSAAALERTQRQIVFEDILRRHGVEPPAPAFWTTNDAVSAPHASPLLAAYNWGSEFAPPDQAHHVFVALYLRGKLNADVGLGESAESLLKRFDSQESGQHD